MSAIREHRVALTPTLHLWTDFARHDRISAQERITETSVTQLRAWLACGGTVLFGTDAGAAAYDPRQEYRLMALAGMSLSEILDSLTTAPAQCFGDSSSLGRIAKGYRADLVVLRADLRTTCARLRR